MEKVNTIEEILFVYTVERGWRELFITKRENLLA